MAKLHDEIEFQLVNNGILNPNVSLKQDVGYQSPIFRSYLAVGKGLMPFQHHFRL